LGTSLQTRSRTGATLCENESTPPKLPRRVAARNLSCVVSYEAGVNEVTKAAAVTFRCGA